MISGVSKAARLETKHHLEQLLLWVREQVLVKNILSGESFRCFQELEAAIKDAEENMGDIEVRDARLAKADYLCKLGAPPIWPACVG